MLTSDQKAWLNHLNDTDSVRVSGFNPSVKDAFKKIKAELMAIVGDAPILHRGSTSLGIAGQGEIDLYIPVAKKNFNITLKKLESHLGKPGSIYEMRRVRFVKYIDGIKVEIFLINRNLPDWTNCLKFERYLRQHPADLIAYEKLKIKNAGKSTKIYYTEKNKFINKILKK